jgi:ribonuclease H / adenosylcobalamin/alpha-ribazole phosphatase
VSRRLVVEADGGSRGNPGPAGYGALVRDAETGDVLLEVAESVGVASNNVAEYSGLVAGLLAAASLDPRAQVEVRMDSKLVVEQMSGRWKIKHEDMRRLAARAREAFAPAQVRYTWVPRERNGAADRLANQAMDDAGQGRPWRGSTGGPSVPTSPAAPAEVPAAPVARVARAAPVALAADLGEPSTLLLLRHGVTPLSRERRFSGAGGSDPALTEAGRRQAVAAASVLAAGEPLTAVVSSPLLRCRQTAQVVADRLGLPVRVDQDWRECAFGAWDGLTAAEVARGWPAEYAAWSGSTAVPPPDGESLDAVDRRALRARDRVIADHPRGRVLVVTHVGPIKALVRAAIGAGPEVVWRLDLAPASISRTRWWTDAQSSLVSFNETGHLGPLPPDGAPAT